MGPLKRDRAAGVDRRKSTKTQGNGRKRLTIFGRIEMTMEIKTLETRLKDGRIGRREFLQGATAIGVSIAVATTLAG